MLDLFLEITTYALADSVNPCEIAILSMILITILIANPDKKKTVLKAGLMFSLAVFLAYSVYAGILIQLFKGIAGFFARNSSLIRYILGGLAMLLGALNIKDFINYKKGSIGTEMPLFLRPKAKKIISGITSPKGAFFIGFLVTLFLLPCTAGPLILAAGALSKLTFIETIPWVIYYNLIFILPMIIITLLVYFGFKKIEEVEQWKERNIKKLHLIAGALLFLVGFAIIKGWL